MAKKARTICPQERATCSCRPCGKHDDHSWMDQLRPLGPTKRTKKKESVGRFVKIWNVPIDAPVCLMLGSSIPRTKNHHHQAEDEEEIIREANQINVNKTDNSKSSGKEMFDELNSKIEKAMKQHNTDAYGTDKASTKVANSRKA
ncbi:hypothetical protein T07_13581 [Trichinella nelsoni]|uniref:Uncharacterized protein n=1 Tax=Trichinella nelsoni TaxID=6336 RepID=A0A0V0SC36_9BILA|nr:hypothetical protein T07_13581 [Trichinella nelsoni]